MTLLKPTFLILIGLLAFTTQAQVHDSIPIIIEVDSAAAYDEDMPMPAEAIEGYDVDYGDYPVAVTEAPDIEEPMVLFNEFSNKTIAKLEANPDKPARYPGGIGAMETVMTAGLVAAGVNAGIALSAVLLYRLLSFWLPTIPGWIAFRQLMKRELL